MRKAAQPSPYLTQDHPLISPKKKKVKVSLSMPDVWDPMDCSPPGSSVHGQNTGVGSCYFLQGIFPTQGSNPGLLHCRQILYLLSHQESSPPKAAI